MRKLKSKLFKKFELKKAESQLIVGGNYTAAGLDTSMNAGLNFDTIKETCNNGESTQDVIKTCTSSSTKDKPVNSLQSAP